MPAPIKSFRSHHAARRSPTVVAQCRQALKVWWTMTSPGIAWRRTEESDVPSIIDTAKVPRKLLRLSVAAVIPPLMFLLAACSHPEEVDPTAVRACALEWSAAKFDVAKAGMKRMRNPDGTLQLSNGTAVWLIVLPAIGHELVYNGKTLDDGTFIPSQGQEGDAFCVMYKDPNTGAWTSRRP